MCFLHRADRSAFSEEELAEIQSGHLAYLNKLSEEKKICLAGPFGDDEDLRGIVLYRIPEIEEARKLASEDPAVKAGILTVELRPWWGAKGTILE